MMSELVKVLIATVVSGVVLYIGIVNKLRSQLGIQESRIKQLEENCKEVTRHLEETSKLLTVLDEKSKRLEQRQDSHSKKNDEVVKLINDLSLEVTKQLGNMNTAMVKIASEVENINSTIAIFDEGIRSKKRKSK